MSDNQNPLHSFYIFNSSYGPREGEEVKKIFYYFPLETSENEKCKHIGFSEAMINFVKTFTMEPCESVHTKRQRQIYLEVEEGFYIILKLRVNRRSEPAAAVPAEFTDENLHDSVYISVLQNSYDMFKLFMGSFKEILSKYDVPGLKLRLNRFFTKYLVSLKWASCDLLDVFNGISWLPLDNPRYLRLQCIINRLESKYSQIAYTSLLFNDYLIWSSLPQHEMTTLYSYLITSLFPDHHEKQISAGVDKTSQYGQFITGVPMKNDKNFRTPRIHMYKDDQSFEYALLAYRVSNVTFCALIDPTQISLDFYRQLEADIRDTLVELGAEIINTSPSKRSLTDSVVKYIYFNKINLAVKSTIHTDSRRLKNVTVPQYVLSSLADIHSHINGSTEDIEYSLKTAGDYWIVCKCCDNRQLYVVVNDRNANLSQINDEVRKLCTSQFQHMFLSDT